MFSKEVWDDHTLSSELVAEINICLKHFNTLKKQVDINVLEGTMPTEGWCKRVIAKLTHWPNVESSNKELAKGVGKFRSWLEWNREKAQREDSNSYEFAISD